MEGYEGVTVEIGFKAVPFEGTARYIDAKAALEDLRFRRASAEAASFCPEATEMSFDACMVEVLEPYRTTRDLAHGCIRLAAEVKSLKAELADRQRQFDEEEAQYLSHVFDLEEVVDIVKRARPFDGNLSGLTYRDMRTLQKIGFFSEADGVDPEDEAETLREGDSD